MKALKLLFFADRYHLRKYGRALSDCAYFAMKNGPVASEAKNVAEENARLCKPALAYVRHFLRRHGQYDASSLVRSVAAMDKAVLSESDLEALDFAWQTFGHHDKETLVDITHHYPEWKRHERALASGGRRRIEMDYTDFFAEPDAGYDPCHELTARDRSVGRELFQDRQAVAALWK